MKLDSEDQRQLLLNLIGAVQVPGGDALDKVFELKQIIRMAKVENDNMD